MQATGDNDISLTVDMVNQALLDVEHHLQQQNKSLLLYGMPLPEDITMPTNFLSQMEAAEHAYNVHECAAEVQHNVPKLRQAQQEVWNQVTKALDSGNNDIVSVDATYFALLMYPCVECATQLIAIVSMVQGAARCCYKPSFVDKPCVLTGQAILR